MSRTVIRVENLSKRYRLGVLGHQSLRKEIQSRWARIRGKDDPNTCVVGWGRDPAARGDLLWALQDVSFEVQQGDVVGIVGRNGAGKSTLLKILSRVTTPTRGAAFIKGKVASLLEVGTGFHPELTGRENIFLNGAILGMRHKEIERKLDEIVAFAEVERFVDTPVKRYSSGMYVRLAFSVAAHLDQEVLIVDEVLAVGDVQFQRKCLGKMGSVAQSGRTVLFVSHNLNAVRNLCSRALLFEDGYLALNGTVEEGLAMYERSFSSQGGVISEAHFSGPLTDQVRFDRVACVQGGETVNVVDPKFGFRIELHGFARRSFPAIEFDINLFREGLHIASCFDAPQESGLHGGGFASRFEIPADVLLPGRYTIGVGAVAAMGEWTWGPDVAVLDVADSSGGPFAGRKRGLVIIPYATHRSQ